MTEIMILLVVVVLLILAIGFFVMRFLRADSHPITVNGSAHAILSSYP